MRELQVLYLVVCKGMTLCGGSFKFYPHRLMSIVIELERTALNLVELTFLEGNPFTSHFVTETFIGEPITIAQILSPTPI